MLRNIDCLSPSFSERARLVSMFPRSCILWRRRSLYRAKAHLSIDGIITQSEPEVFSRSKLPAICIATR